MFTYKESMDRLIQNEVTAGAIAGANVLVLHNGKEIYHNTFGFRNKENHLPMERDTIIRLFSMSKPITAAATMILAERGDIDLWDPVSMYFPSFQNQVVWGENGQLIPVERDVTIWDLLNMTSGIPYPEDCTESGKRMDALFKELIQRRVDGDAPDTQEYINRIAQIPLVFQPGDRWMYGVSADILGGIIEVVSGKKYGDFLQDELFHPLEMFDTGFGIAREKESRFAQIYDWNEEASSLVPFMQSFLGEYYGEKVAFESGGAGMTSTIDDYSHFAQMMLQKGVYKGQRILGEKTVEFMTRDRLSEYQKKDYQWNSNMGCGYGCLMRILVDQGLAGTIGSLGEYGWDGWTGNYVTIDPSTGLVFLYYIQRCGAGTTPLVRKLRMLTYAQIEKKKDVL